MKTNNPPPTHLTVEQRQALKNSTITERYVDVSREAVRALVRCYDGPDSVLPGERLARPDEGPRVLIHKYKGYKEANEKTMRRLRHQMTIVLGGGDRVRAGLTPTAQDDHALSICRALVEAWDRQGN